jgi:hypothetical protein
MLSEKGFRIEQAINNEWAKSHIYCPLDYARIAAQAVLALERPAAPEPESLLSKPEARLSDLTQEVMTKAGWKFAMECTETTPRGTSICIEYVKPVALEPQKQVTVSKNSVLIDGDVCATFSGKDSLDAAQDYARLRIARLAELAKEASNG